MQPPQTGDVVTPPALEIIGLHKYFGALCVAHDIHFRLDTGARYALIGPNGAGKTTFVNLITGVVKPSSGRIRLEGVDITRLSQAKRSRLGIARTFQINQLFRGLTVLENVCLSVAERTAVSRSLFRPLGRQHAVIDDAMQLLEAVNLSQVALKPVAELAYGQQRLVEMAIALGQGPKVLLLDEPAAGVPSSESRIIFDVIERLNPDISILMIEHDMEVVFRFAMRIAVLAEGHLVADGPAAEIAANPRVKALYLGDFHD